MQLVDEDYRTWPGGGFQQVAEQATMIPFNFRPNSRANINGGELDGISCYFVERNGQKIVLSEGR